MSSLARNDNSQNADERLEMGQADSTRFAVMNHIINLRYDKASEVVKEFVRRPSDYPNFEIKANNYANKALKTIEAIKLKRIYSQNPNLTAARNQEVLARVKDHLRELSFTLGRLEQVEKDLKIADSKSTVITVKTAVVCVCILVVLFFLLDISTGLGKMAITVVDDYYTKFINYISK
jgi:hypothetical protein